MASLNLFVQYEAALSSPSNMNFWNVTFGTLIDFSDFHNMMLSYSLKEFTKSPYISVICLQCGDKAWFKLGLFWFIRVVQKGPVTR